MKQGTPLTHGHCIKGKKSPEYITWQSMWDRCTKPTKKNYKWYGARGISVCERWRNFETFIQDMGRRPEGTSLERKDGSGNYEPSNCKWATAREQANNSRHNVLLTFNGKTLNIMQWANTLGWTHDMIWSRLNRGWSVENALTEPFGSRRFTRIGEQKGKR